MTVSDQGGTDGWLRGYGISLDLCRTGACGKRKRADGVSCRLAKTPAAPES